jgi:hypothetical protein
MQTSLLSANSIVLIAGIAGVTCQESEEKNFEISRVICGWLSVTFVYGLSLVVILLLMFAICKKIASKSLPSKVQPDPERNISEVKKDSNIITFPPPITTSDLVPIYVAPPTYTQAQQQTLRLSSN